MAVDDVLPGQLKSSSWPIGFYRSKQIPYKQTGFSTEWLPFRRLFKCIFFKLQLDSDVNDFFSWRYHWFPSTLPWRHNDHGGVPNHQPHDCLLNRLFRRRSKKTSKLPVTGLCERNSSGPVNSPHKGPVTRKMFPFDDVIMRYVVTGHVLISIWLYLCTIFTANVAIIILSGYYVSL